MAKKHSKQFTYRVAYYDEAEQAKPPTQRTASTVQVQATSVGRALSRAFRELGLSSQHQWHVVSVSPILGEVEARHYSV